MKTTLTIAEHYNVGPYEWVEIGASVEGAFEQDGDLAELEDTLDAAMANARHRVLAMNSNHESMIQDHPALTGDA